jgi:hypothetical protein
MFRLLMVSISDEVEWRRRGNVEAVIDRLLRVKSGQD